MYFVQELNAEPVIPEGFPEWKDTMDAWGVKMISAIEASNWMKFSPFLLCCIYAHNLKPSLYQAVAEMAAIGFGLPRDAFTSLMKQVSA